MVRVCGTLQQLALGVLHSLACSWFLILVLKPIPCFTLAHQPISYDISYEYV